MIPGPGDFSAILGAAVLGCLMLGSEEAVSEAGNPIFAKAEAQQLIHGKVAISE
jgi:hypothetical protein